MGLGHTCDSCMQTDPLPRTGAEISGRLGEVGRSPRNERGKKGPRAFPIRSAFPADSSLRGPLLW